MADALLRRHDVVGLLLVARALCQADDQTTDWLLSAFHDEFLQSYEDLALAESLLSSAVEQGRDADAEAGLGRLRQLTTTGF